MAMLQNTLAALGLLVCLTLLLRMALPTAKQQRFDAFWRRLGWRLRGMGAGLRQRWRMRRAGRDARREAADAIERARRGRAPVERDGNVIRPGQFSQRDSKKPPLH